MLQGRGEVRGTFNAMNLLGLLAGSTQERTAAAAEKTAANTGRILRELDGGGVGVELFGCHGMGRAAGAGGSGAGGQGEAEVREKRSAVGTDGQVVGEYVRFVPAIEGRHRTIHADALQPAVRVCHDERSVAVGFDAQWTTANIGKCLHPAIADAHDIAVLRRGVNG